MNIDRPDDADIEYILPDLRPLAFPLAKLAQDPANARRHDEKNLGAIIGSIRRYGQRTPIVANRRDMTVLKGNGTLQSMRSIGCEYAAVVFVEDDPTTATGYAIADNRAGELATWDLQTLVSHLDSLQASDVDVSELGFSPSDVETFLSDAGDKNQSSGDVEEVEPQIDRAEELRAEWGTESGQLWLIEGKAGTHRLLCGDSTQADDVQRLLGDRKPFIMVTDPPYGVKLDQSWRDSALGEKAMGPGNRNVVDNDDNADWTETWSLFSGDVCYVWHAGKFSDVVMASLRRAGFEICQQIIWNKSVMVMGRSDYHFKHEPCWYAVRKGRAHGWIGDRTQTTVIDAKSPNHIMSGSDEDKTDHPTQKPVECMAYLMRNHNGPVYDPFLGSGTTMLAAEQLGRRCYGIEISPAYCAVILQRMKDFGCECKLEGG